MNKTRIELINLLEKYMDKTLSEGCLLNISPNWYSTWIYKVISYRDYYTWISSWIEKITLKWFKTHHLYERTDEWRWNWYDFDKIWHYDITAVLKYISKTEYFIEYCWRCFIVRDYTEEYIWEILNKPLHLYTEQEEIQLLNLLNKLK